MSRRAQNPVDAAFDRWADLTPEQKKHFAWAMEGYNSVRRDAIRDNGGVEPERVAPRTRQRKVKPNGSDTRVTTTLTAEDMQATIAKNMRDLAQAAKRPSVNTTIG